MVKIWKILKSENRWIIHQKPKTGTFYKPITLSQGYYKMSKIKNRMLYREEHAIVEIALCSDS